MPEKVELLSEKLGSRLLHLIYVWAGVVVLINTNAIFTLVDPGGAASRETGMGMVGLAGIFIVISVIVAFINWVFRLHIDLQIYFPGYCISPRKALALTGIPIYNVWGLWKIAKELFENFKSRGVDVSWNSMNLQTLYIISILLGFVNNVLSGLAMRKSFAVYDFKIKLCIEIGTCIVGLIIPALWYVILSLVMRGMKRIQHESNPPRIELLA